MGAKNYSLIADIGGTNARFALLEDGGQSPIEPRSLTCADYPTIIEAIRAYLDFVPFVKPSDAAIAVATAVTNDQLNMTNHSWNFSINETRQVLGLEQFKVINDFTALALALPHLSDEKCLQVGGGLENPGQVKAVIGPGTGLGVSGVVPINQSWFPLQGEGGHVSYGPLNEREAQVIELIRQNMGHVSAESLVSGSGLSLLYRAIAQLEGGEAIRPKPQQITQQAVDGICPVAMETLSMFCDILGTVAGNLALTLGARGGVYIGGGIVPRILDFFSDSGFRERFQQHGRFTQYLSEIRSYVIIADYPALIGAAISLRPEYSAIGVTSHE